MGHSSVYLAGSYSIKSERDGFNINITSNIITQGSFSYDLYMTDKNTDER